MILILVSGFQIVLTVMVYMNGVTVIGMKVNGVTRLDMDRARTILQMETGLSENISTESHRDMELTNGKMKIFSLVSFWTVKNADMEFGKNKTKTVRKQTFIRENI